MLVLIAAGLLHEYHLIHTGILVLAQAVAELFGRADAVALRDIRDEWTSDFEPLPQVGRAWLVLAVDVEMAKREAEILERFQAAGFRFGFVMMDGEAGRHGDVGVHRVADGDAFLGLDDVVIFAGPFARFGWIDEGEGQSADAGPRGGVDGFFVGTRDPDRRMRF